MAHRPRVWAEIDLSAISRNLGVVRGRLNDRCSIMLVVKADAYGHGAISVARHVLARNEAVALGVGDSGEALELRQAGIDAPILILGAVVDGEMESVVRNDIAVCVHSLSRVRKLDREAKRQKQRCRVHVMVDTGMGRLGPFPDRAFELALAVKACEWLDLEGVATHFSSATRPQDPFTREQIDRFRSFRDRFQSPGIDKVIFHSANSGAVFEGDFDSPEMVRVGAAAYGLLARRDGAAALLEPALSLRTQVIYLKDVPAGTPISYEHLHVTDRKTRIATLPVGYNDGLRFGLSDGGYVLVRGKKVPIVGAISMDYCMVDVGSVPGVRAGEEVTVIGKDGGEEITVPDLADRLGTVPYEITCGLGRRVRRIYSPRQIRPMLTEAVGDESISAEEVIEGA